MNEATNPKTTAATSGQVDQIVGRSRYRGESPPNSQAMLVLDCCGYGFLAATDNIRKDIFLYKSRPSDCHRACPTTGSDCGSLSLTQSNLIRYQ